ncbi:MAG: Holliday junction branch migration protein RuvA [SAR202 cluster bacterium]|nr:Holliday junction branch migration protein RuvA [SAR202 cluster bacterium]
MITGIEGKLVNIGIGWVEVFVGGFTLRVNVPVPMADSVGAIGETVRLYTSFQVREDGMSLYGFSNTEYRQAFEALLTVNGVGNKVAMSVLSRLSPESLAAAVATGDTDAFKGIPGVGPKTGSRIVLELKGKLNIELTAAPAAAGEGDVLQALTALGYTVAEATQAAASVPKGAGLTFEDRVRMSLQFLAGR